MRDDLIDRLRKLVVEEELKPCNKVPEKDLVESLGVSRMPFCDGFLVLQTNRSIRVANVTRQETKSTFSVIAHLEQLAEQLASEQLDTAGLT